VAATVREAVSRLLITLQAGNLDEGLLKAACRQLEARKSGAPGAVLVESAVSLDDEARSAIRTAADARDDIQFRVVPDLGAGLRVTTPGGLIDASAAGIAAHAERVLASALAEAESKAKD